MNIRNIACLIVDGFSKWLPGQDNCPPTQLAMLAQKHVSMHKLIVFWPSRLKIIMWKETLYRYL